MRRFGKLTHVTSELLAFVYVKIVPPSANASVFDCVLTCVPSIFFEPVTWDEWVVGFDHVPGGASHANTSVLSYHIYEPPDVSEKDTIQCYFLPASNIHCGLGFVLTTHADLIGHLFCGIRGRPSEIVLWKCVPILFLCLMLFAYQFNFIAYRCSLLHPLNSTGFPTEFGVSETNKLSGDIMELADRYLQVGRYRHVHTRADDD